MSKEIIFLKHTRIDVNPYCDNIKPSNLSRLDMAITIYRSLSVNSRINLKACVMPSKEYYTSNGYHWLALVELILFDENLNICLV